MADLNQVQIIGRLGQDPETRYMPSGEAVTNITVATSEKWKDKSSGELKEATEWHRVSFFGRLAEIAGEYLKKGSQVFIQGSLRTRKWQDKNGNDRYTTEIRGRELIMLGSKAGGESQAAPAAAAKPGAKPVAKAGSFDDMADDIPF